MTAAFAVDVVIAIAVGILLTDILPHRAMEVAVALTFFAGAVSRSGAGTTRRQADRLELSSVPYALGA